MATQPTDIRTFAVTGQGGVGKTSLADAMLFAGGGANRLGKVDDETSLFDTEPEEIRRRCTITGSLHHLPWKKCELTVLDTPGQGNFVTGTLFGLRGVTGAVFVVDASSGLRAEASKVWGWIKDEGLPTIVVLNRLDRPEADVDQTLAALSAELDAKVGLLQLPIKRDDVLVGIADVLTGKAHIFEGDSGKFSTEDLPADLVDPVEELRMEITEAAAEGDDELLEKYLEDGELEPDEVVRGLRGAVAAGEFAPVFCASAAMNLGVSQILDAVADLFPPPTAGTGLAGKDGDENDTVISPDPAAPFCAYVFKTIHDPHTGQLSVARVLSGKLTSDVAVVNVNRGAKERLGHLLKIEGKKHSEVEEVGVGEIFAVAKLKSTHVGDTLAEAGSSIRATPIERPHPTISFALEAEKRGEEDKVSQGLHKLEEEDLALHVERDEETGEILVSGAGQLHVEVACERLARKYSVAVNLKAPKVPYRETISKAADAHGRLKKQSGGHGQFADCRIVMEPLPHGAGFEFVDKIVGGAIPRGFIPAVEKGVREAMKQGVLAGFPVVDVRVTLNDGQFHDVDSSEMAFKVAGSLAFKDGLAKGRPVLLEPFVNLLVTVPDECMGDVMGDLNSRRAKVEGMEQKGSNQAIKAKVPMSEVLRYAPDLTSMTSGRGSFEMGFSHYERCPEHLVAKVVEETKGGE